MEVTPAISARNPNLAMPFDPNREELWWGGSDVDWVRGSMIAEYEHPAVFARRHPWLPGNEQQARRIILDHREETFRLLGALMSWRVCTVSQLLAGLCPIPLPEFNRDQPGLWGALARLGVINIGFSPRERLEGTQVNQIWVSMGNKRKYTLKLLKTLGTKGDMYRMYERSNMVAARIHARHNTYAAHAGLMLKQDERMVFTSGDGYSGFRRIDQKALDTAGLNRASAADVVALGCNGTLTGIEVQSGVRNMEKKIEHWAKLLANSPMQRRGLLCVWLLIPDATRWEYPVFNTLLDTAAGRPEMAAGMPNVASRMGVARWDEWFNNGRPTERIGQYRDMYGVERSIFDPQWAQAAPDVPDMSRVTDWGWNQMRASIKEEWGWDTTGIPLPDEYRGRFYGLAFHNDPTVPKKGRGRHAAK